MFVRVAIFLVLILGIVGLGAVAFVALSPPPPAAATAAPAAAPEPTRAVLTAVRTLRTGTLVKADDIVSKSLTDAELPANAIFDTPQVRADLFGALVRRTIVAGDPIQADEFIRVGDRGFLAAVLRPGMRAVAVGVDPVAGLAGLIWPGDYVDLILTQQTDGPETAAGHRLSGETVLRSLRVIAVDQDLGQGANGSMSPGNLNAQQTRTVTLETSPTDAERVAIASRLGHLSLAVVAIGEQPPSEQESAAAADAAAHERPDARNLPVLKTNVLWGDDVSLALRKPQTRKSEGAGLRVYDGTAEGKEVHFP
jgi:pilus assembly protein CpaB